MFSLLNKDSYKVLYLPSEPNYFGTYLVVHCFLAVSTILKKEKQAVNLTVIRSRLLKHIKDKQELPITMIVLNVFDKMAFFLKSVNQCLRQMRIIIYCNNYCIVAE